MTMLACIYSRKFGAAIVGAAIILAGTSVDCYSQTGSIHLTVVKAGVVVSTGSGTGTLDYQGRRYPLRVSTFGFGTIGVSGGALAPPTTCGLQRTSPAHIGRCQPGLRSAPAQGLGGFKMRTVSSSIWLEHS